jgi:5-methylcytosine-specific restriction endonuclease McrA
LKRNYRKLFGHKSDAYYDEMDKETDDWDAEFALLDIDNLDEAQSENFNDRVAKRTASRKEKERAKQKRNSPEGYYHAIPYDKFTEHDLDKIIKKWNEYNEYKARMLDARKINDTYNAPINERIKADEDRLLAELKNKRIRELEDELANKNSRLSQLYGDKKILERRLFHQKRNRTFSFWRSKDEEETEVALRKNNSEIDIKLFHIEDCKKQLQNVISPPKGWKDAGPQSTERKLLREFSFPDFKGRTVIELVHSGIPYEIDVKATHFKIADVRDALVRKRKEALAAAHVGKTRIEAEKIKSERTIKHQLDILPDCPYCAKPFDNDKAHADHIYPVAKGGLSTMKNMVYICPDCNTKKKDKTLIQFARKYNLDLKIIESNLILLRKDF